MTKANHLPRSCLLKEKREAGTSQCDAVLSQCDAVVSFASSRTGTVAP